MINRQFKSPARLVWLVSVMCLVATVLSGRPWPHVGSDLPVDERLVQGHLSNGVRYVILPWSEPPERVSLQLLVEAGFLQETERQIGLAHLIEHMAFNGTKNFSAGEMVEYFQRLGMAFGPDTNAHTWWRETVYKLELPNGSEELLRDGLLLMRDYADGMLLETEEIEQEKGIVLSELRERDTPGMRAWREQLRFTLPDSWISQWRQFSEMDIVRMAQRQDLVDFYEKWYIPQKLVLVAVGDVVPEQLVALFEEYFASMEPAETLPQSRDLGEIRPEAQRMGFFSQPELPRTEVRIMTRRAIEPEVPSQARYMEDVTLSMANFIVSRRFERLSKEEGSPIMSGAGYDYRWLEFVRLTGIVAFTRAAEWQPTLDLVSDELRRAIEYGFSDAEFHEAQATVLRDLRERARGESTRRSRDLSATLVRSIRDNFVFMNPAAEAELFIPQIEQLDAAAVHAAFRAAWDQEERLVWVSGDFAPVVETQFVAALERPVTPPQHEEMAAFAYTDFGPAGRIVSDTYIEDLSVRQVAFANNVRVNLKRTEFEANRIQVKVSFGNGRLTEDPERPGLGMLASSVFVQGGLGAHSFDELQRILAQHTVSINFDTEDAFFSMSGATNQEDLELQLQLISAYLLDPAYRPEALRRLHQQLDAFYTQLRHSPDAILQNRGERFLRSGDPRFGVPERAQLEARTLAELAEWLEFALKHSYLEVAIVGDFADADAVLAKVAQTLGALPRRVAEYDRMEAARQVAFASGAEPQLWLFPSSQDFGITTLHWHTADDSDVEKTRRLSILASVLSDRMRRVVREEAGETYSPFAFNRSTPFTDFGFIRAYSGVYPRNAGMVTDMILNIAAGLYEDGIDADELLRAVEPVKSSIRQTRRNNGYWVNSVVLRSQSEPQRLDWARTFLDFWDTITVEQINDLARTFLHPDQAVIIQILPQS